MDSQTLLKTWEAAEHLSAQRWACTMLAADDSSALESCEHLPIGRRDAALLKLRESLFGPMLKVAGTCVNCGIEVTVDLQTSQLTCEPRYLPQDRLDLTVDGYRVACRLPHSVDLAAIVHCAEVESAAQLLQERCIGACLSPQGTPVEVADLPPDVLHEVIEQMSQADPQADVQLAFRCPDCAHEWTLAFDIVSYLWLEVDAWSQRTLGDVADLAAAYGWREADILAMSARRRRYYLELQRR